MNSLPILLTITAMQLIVVSIVTFNGIKHWKKVMVRQVELNNTLRKLSK